MGIKPCGICDFKSDSINEIGLVDFKGIPMLKISFKTKIKDFNIKIKRPLSTGLEIYLANEFLRSLNTGIDVKFESFIQYNELLKNIAYKLNIPYMGDELIMEKQTLGNDLILQVNELMEENERLKAENVALKNQELYGWENLKAKIELELSKLPVRGQSDCAKWKIKDAIAQIIRETLNISFVKNLRAEDYMAAKEIVETILDLVEKHFKETKRR